MTYPYRLLAPGPVQIPDYAKKILAEPMVHHRSPLFTTTLSRVYENLKKVFCTKEDVYILTSTGSGAMEATIVNTLSPGDEVIAIIAGKFGERWAKMAETYGMQVHPIHVDWGESVSPDLVEATLKTFPKTKAILVQACETSTGVAQDIQALAKITARYPDCLICVDAITYILSNNLPMDEWGIDVIVAGSQKAFMLPTGLSFLSFSKKAQKAIEQAKCPSYYFNIKNEKKSLAANQTKFSSSVAEIRALDAVLTEILNMGLTAFRKEIETRANATRKALAIMELRQFPKKPATALSAIVVPEVIDGKKLRKHIEEKYNTTFMGGQDQLEGKIIRIGHIGAISKQDVVASIEVLGKALEDFGYNSNWKKAVQEVVNAYEA